MNKKICLVNEITYIFVNAKTYPVICKMIKHKAQEEKIEHNKASCYDQPLKSI